MCIFRGSGPGGAVVAAITMTFALAACGSIEDRREPAGSTSSEPPGPSSPSTQSGPSPARSNPGQSTPLPAGAEPDPVASPAPSGAPAPNTGVAADAGSDAVVVAARRDLSSRKGFSESEIGLVSFENVTWPDSALGCPSKDIRYEPGAVAGYRVVLEGRGVTYTYHGAFGGRGPFLCQFLD